MSHLYLAPYVGTGKWLDPFRPRGHDQAGWLAYDLRGAQVSGRALMFVPVRDDTIGEYLGGSLDEVSATVKAKIESRLGLSLRETATKRMLFELFMEHGREDGSRWRGLRPSRTGRYRLWLGGRLLGEAGISGGASLSDTFDTNGDLDGSGPSWTWTEFAGTGWTVTTQRATFAGVVGDIGARADSDLASDDHSVQATLVSTTTQANLGAGVIARKDATTAKTFYLWSSEAAATRWAMYRANAGSYTELAAWATAPAASDVMKLELDANDYTGYVNGTARVGPTTDGSPVTGNVRCGLRGYSDNAGNTVEIDDWSAADLTAAAGNPWHAYAQQ